MLVLNRDQPNNTLYYLAGDELEARTAYGDLRADTSVRKLVPMLFVQIFDRLAHFNLPNAKPWLPKKIELLLQRYKGSEEPLLWPNGWPRINNQNSIERGELVSFFIDSQVP